MIEWFLRLFPQYRDAHSAWENRNERCRELDLELSTVREAYNAEVQAHLRTQDRLDAATQETRRVWDIAQNAINGERYSYQSQINVLSQRSGGGVPYAEAHALPDNAVPRPQEGGPVGRAGRMLPSQRAAMAQADGVRAIVEELRQRAEG